MIFFPVLLQFTVMFEVHHQTQQHPYRNISGVNQFDAVEKDVNSHVHEIENKVLSIISNLITVQVNQWDARPPVPSQAFRNISRCVSVFVLKKSVA
jgi:vacuolar protein sorting-associated protein 54